MKINNPFDPTKAVEAATKSAKHTFALLVIASIIFCVVDFLLIKFFYTNFEKKPELRTVVLIAGSIIFIVLFFVLIYAIIKMSKPSSTKDRTQIAALCYKKENNVNKFLLQRTKENDAWNFPKGTLDPLKDDLNKPSTCAIRWARMESGVKAISNAKFENNPHEIWHVKIDQKKSSSSQGEPPVVERIKLHVYFLAFETNENNPESARNPTWHTLEECETALKIGRSKKQADQFMEAIRYANSVI
jgi:hypothetical protein